MSDIASAELPDVGSLQPPPELPDVGALTEAPAGNVPPLRASMQPGSFSQGVVARARNGDALTRTITKLGQGFATGYGDSFTGITADDQQTMIDAGIKPVTAGGIGTVGGTLRFYGQSLMAAASSVKAAVFSLYGGVQGAVEQGVTQAAKEAGAANPERVGAEAAGFTEFMASDAHINTMLLSRAQYAEATRIAPNPATGGFYDQRIGPVPDHVEAAQQAATVASHYGVDIAPAIQAAYDKGVLPAEIFHDAKVNPTVLADLVERKVPEAYPTETWAPAPVPLPAPITRQEFERMDIDKLDKAAFGHAGGDIVDLSPKQLHVQPGMEGDIENAREKFKQGGMEWAQSVKYDEPLFASIDQNGKFNIEDGHHRWLAAMKTGRPTVPVEIEIKGKPIEALLKRQEEQGPLDPETLRPIPKGAPAKKPPVVPTRLRPIQGTGELTPMQLSQSVEEAVGKIFDAVPASRVAENAVQEAAARKFVDLDPERADQVAMYGSTPPKNLLGQMVFNEVLRRADEAGDFDKVRMLATQGAQPGILKRYGQEVQAADRLGPEGETAGMIQQLQEKRVADLKAQGIDVPQEQAKGQAAFAPIREATKNLRGAGAWEKFMQSIQCSE